MNNPVSFAEAMTQSDDLSRVMLQARLKHLGVKSRVIVMEGGCYAELLLHPFDLNDSAARDFLSHFDEVPSCT